MGCENFRSRKISEIAKFLFTNGSEAKIHYNTVDSLTGNYVKSRTFKVMEQDGSITYETTEEAPH